MFDWLLDSDIHFFLTHPIQAMYHWNCEDVFVQLQRLQNHVGFPSGEQINCPVFTQDKYQYLSAVPRITNPTLKIALPFSRSSAEDGVEYSEVKQRVNIFIRAYSEGCGWVVKPPFETNCGPKLLKFCSEEEGEKGVYHAIEMLSKTCHPRLPYVILQPKMQNRKEYKVVFTVVDCCKCCQSVKKLLQQVVTFNGEFQYVNDKPKSPSPSKGFSEEPHTRLRHFAEHAIAELNVNCPSAITDGLVRVDIFENAYKELVVNEFESLEAVYYSKLGQASMHSMLVVYWERKIKECTAIYV